MNSLQVFFMVIYPFASFSKAEDCQQEFQLMTDCMKHLSATNAQIVSIEEFEKNQKGSETYLKCVGEPKCTRNQKFLKVYNGKNNWNHEMALIHSCVGNEAYNNAKDKCEFFFADCNLEKATSCVSKALKETPTCTESDIQHFTQLKSLMEQNCELELELFE